MPSRKPFNPRPLISHLTNSNGCGNTQPKVLLTVSPLPPSFPPQPRVSSQPSILSDLCFHGLTNCFSRNPFILRNICVAPGVWGTPLVNLQRSNLQTWQLLCPHLVANSLVSPKNSTRLQSSKSKLFRQNTQVGYPQCNYRGHRHCLHRAKRWKQDHFGPLAFHSYPQYTFGFKVSWEPFAYDSSFDGPIFSSRRRHVLCPILARTVIVGNGADIHKRCRANLAKELSGLSSAGRTWSVLHAHL